MPSRLTAIVLVALSLSTVVAKAQAPDAAPPASPYPAAEAALAAGDTAKALRVLLEQGMRGDAEAWSRRAALATRRLPFPWRRPAIISPDSPDAGLWRDVEDALRNAVRLAPDSARYWLALARHQLLHRSGAAHHEGYASLDTALAAAHRVAGADGFAITAYDGAMLFWRQWQQYDGRAEQSLSSWEVENIVADREAPYPRARHFLVADAQRPRLGDQELHQATLLLAAAADSAPSIQLARRRHYAGLATAERWEEVRSVAQRRLRARHGDWVDLLALGLARHRLGESYVADSAFLAARAAMPPASRARLTSIARILPAAERAQLAALSEAARELAEERAWLLADPLWRVPGNEVRSEFLARVAYAELRWGDGSEWSGVESDPGAAWLTFGPPQLARTLGEDGFNAGVGSALISWRWQGRTQLQFHLAPNSLEERLGRGERPRLDSVIATHGAYWGNVRGMLGIDSIAVQAALFRAGRDSGDLFVAARVPTERLTRGMSEKGRIALDLWIRTPDGRLVRRDSSQWDIDPAQRRTSAVRVWRPRLANGSYLHRVEAWEPVQGRGARGGSLPASLDDASFSLRGFGVSQVLVTERVATRAGVATADRWTDYSIVPSPGDLHRDRSVALLWEVYGDSATALDHYRVDVTLQPPSAAASRSFVSQAASGVVGTAVRRTREKNRVTVSYERRHELPAAVRVEQVDLGAVKVVPGVYVLRIDVTDLATRRTRTTSRLVTVR